MAPKFKEPKKADGKKKKEDSPESSGRGPGTPESYEFVNKDHHADTTSFIKYWEDLTSKKLRISYVSDISGERFQAYLANAKKGDNPVYRPRYEDSTEKAMKEADIGLYKACQERGIKLKNEPTCIVQ